VALALVVWRERQCGSLWPCHSKAAPVTEYVGHERCLNWVSNNPSAVSSTKKG
jgi:hypothetical protein